MARTSTASATWNGTLKEGDGRFEARSGTFRGEYSFLTRFENQAGTNPEELIAAAHAACLSMALSAGLEKAGTPATTITTTAHCTMEVSEAGPRISAMRLVVHGTVAGIDQDTFQQAAQEAKSGCPVSRALQGNVALELVVTLET